MMDIPSRVRILAFDLAYLSTGWAILEEPGDRVYCYGVIRATPISPRKVDIRAMIERERTAYRGLQKVLFSPETTGIDHIVYEMMENIGGAHRGKRTSLKAVLGLGRAEGRLLYSLSHSWWAQTPISKVDPNLWQPTFVGVYPRGTKSKEMKKLVYRNVALRMKEAGATEIPKQPDVVDAIAIGMTVGSWIINGHWPREES